jgi:hypothetical protein
MNARGGIHDRCITLPLLCAPAACMPPVLCLQSPCLQSPGHRTRYLPLAMSASVVHCALSCHTVVCCVLQCEQTQDNKGCTTVGVCGKTPEVAGLQVRPEAAVCSALRCASLVSSPDECLSM